MGPTLERSARRSRKFLLYASFGLFGKTEIKGHLRMRSNRIQILKIIFKSPYVGKVVLYMGDGTMPLIEFVDWLGS